MLVSYLSIGLVYVLSVQARFIHHRRDEEEDLKPTCTNIKTDFTQSMDDWVLQKGSTEENCKQTPEGLRMRLIAPSSYERLYDKNESMYKQQILKR